MAGEPSRNHTSARLEINTGDMKDSAEPKVLKELPNFLNTFGTKFTNCICCGEDFDDSLEGLKEETRRSQRVLKDICIKSVVPESKVLTEVSLDKDTSFPFCSGCVSSTILKLTEMYRQLQVVQEGFNEARYTLVSDLIRCYVKVFFNDEHKPHPTEESIFSYWRKYAIRNTWEAFEEPLKSEIDVAESGQDQEILQPKTRFDLSKVKIEVQEEEEGDEEIILDEAAVLSASETEAVYDVFTDEDFYTESVVSERDDVSDQVKQEPVEAVDETSQISCPSTFSLRKSSDAVVDDDLPPISQLIENALGNFRPRPHVSPPRKRKSVSVRGSCETRKGSKSKSGSEDQRASKLSITKCVTALKKGVMKKRKLKKSTGVVNDTPERRKSLRVRGLQGRKQKLKAPIKSKINRNQRKSAPVGRSKSSSEIVRVAKKMSKSLALEREQLTSNAIEPTLESTVSLEQFPEEELKIVEIVGDQVRSSGKRVLRSSVGKACMTVPQTSYSDNIEFKPSFDSDTVLILPPSPDAFLLHDDVDNDTEDNSVPWSVSPASSSEEDNDEDDSIDEEFEPPKKKRIVKKKNPHNVSKADESSEGTKKRKRTYKSKSDAPQGTSLQKIRGRPRKEVPLSANEDPLDPNTPSNEIKTKKKRVNRPAQCSVCGKMLCSPYNLTLHLRTHSGEKPYSCPYCPMRFLKPPNLKAHLLKHTREKQYCCELCGATFGYPQVLRSHKASLHKIYDHVYTFECNSSDGNCHKKYVTPGEMAKHLRQNHFVEQHADISPFCKIKCEICELTIPDLNTFNEHIKEEEHLQKLKSHRSAYHSVSLHKKSSARAKSESASESTPNADSNQNKTESHASFVESTSVSEKKQFSQVEDPALAQICQWPKKCRAEGCDMMLSNEQNMRLHLKKCHRQRNHVCDICTKAFMEKSHLRQHKILHLDAGEKPFCCDECDEKFNTQASLNRHKTKHTGEGLQSCKYCEKTFRKLKTYRRHMCIQHSDIYLTLEQFFCDCCYLTFRTQEELATHIKQHEDNKCEQCGRLFEYRCELVRHIQNHDKPFKCDQCEKSWTTEAALKEHVERVHSKEKSFKCDQCGLAFYGEKWLQNHIDRMHGRKSAQTRRKKRTQSTTSSNDSSDDSQDCSDEGNESFEQKLHYQPTEPENNLLEVPYTQSLSVYESKDFPR